MLAAKRAARQCWPRSGQNGTTARPTAHDRPRTTTNDRPRDFSTARQDGESKLQSSLDNRLYAKEKSPYDRIKHSCRLTFVSTRDSKVTGEHVKLKQGEMERKTLSYVVKCVDESGLASLQEVTKHRLTEYCLVLFNANGICRKTQKSKLLQKHDHALPRMTDHARMTAHDHALPHTTTHDRPRTTDHGCHICLRKRYPPHPRGVKLSSSTRVSEGTNA